MPENTAWPSHVALINAIEGTKVSLFGQDAELRYRWAVNMPAPWNRRPVVGRTDRELLPREAGAAATAAKQRVLDIGENCTFDLIVGRGTEQRVFSVTAAPDRDDAGHVVGLTGSSVEVTGERKRQATLRTLLREVSHRSKNLLAVVQSIAAQTARGAPAPQDFLAHFNGRLQSLSRSQDLITATDWAGTRMRALIAIQVDPLLEAADRRMTVSGLDPLLTPNATIHVGLALHELAALAIQNQPAAADDAAIAVAVVAAAPADGAEGTLRLTWTEHRSPGSGLPDDFGRTLLTRIVPASIGGDARLSEEDAAFRYQLDIGASEYEG